MNKEEHSYQKSKLTETVHALILGKSEEVNDLYSLIVSTGYHITLAENTDELEITSALKLPFKLVVITDSFSETPGARLLSSIKQHINADKIICLSKCEDHEKERSLRSLGLIFFGSYQSFSVFAEKIINHILNVPDQREYKEVKKNNKSTRKLRVKRIKTSFLNLFLN